MEVDPKRRRRERMNSQDDDCVLLRSERLSDTENDTGASSDNQCSICLDTMNDLAYTDACFHVFCYECLLSWARQKPECPHCRKPFRIITHNIRAPDDYDEYHLPGAAPPPTMLSLATSGMFSPTVQVRLMASMTQHRRRDAMGYQVGFPNTFAPLQVPASNGFQPQAIQPYPATPFSNEAVMFMSEAFHANNHPITIGEYFTRRARVNAGVNANASVNVNTNVNTNGLSFYEHAMALGAFRPEPTSTASYAQPAPTISVSAGGPNATTVSVASNTNSLSANQPGPSTSIATRPSKPSLFERLMSNLPKPTWLSSVQFSSESVDYRRRVYSKRTRVDYRSRLPRLLDDVAPTSNIANHLFANNTNGTVDLKPLINGSQIEQKPTIGLNGVIRDIKAGPRQVVDEEDRMRVEEWLFRELLALLATQSDNADASRTRANAAVMARYVFELLRDGADLSGTAFANRLRPFLADRTDRFVQELDFCVRCRLDVRSFDRHARRVGRYRFSSFPAYWRSLDAESASASSSRPVANRKRRRQWASSLSNSSSSASNDSASTSANASVTDDSDDDDDVEVLPGSSSPRRRVHPPFFSNGFSNTETSAIVIDENDSDADVDTDTDTPSQQPQARNGTESLNSTIRDANRLLRLLNERWNQPSTSVASLPTSTSASAAVPDSTTRANGNGASSNLPSTSSSNESSNHALPLASNVTTISGTSDPTAITQFDSDFLDDVLSVIGEHEANRSTMTISDGEDDEVELVHTEPPRPIELSSSSSESESENESESDSSGSDAAPASVASQVNEPRRQEEAHQSGIES